MPTFERASPIYQRLRVGPMKRLYKHYTPDAVNFAGGVPMDSIFPIQSVSIDVNDSPSLNLSVKNKNLHLNYLRGAGLPELKSWVNGHMTSLHSTPTSSVSDPFSVCMTVGSTDSFSKCLTMFNGDTVLFDEYAYGSAVTTAKTYGRSCIGVSMDSEGMVPADLRRQIGLARDNGLDPDMVYLVPTAHNPTGVTMSPRRKEEIYRVCQDENILVIEDDAYYYLYHGSQDIQKVNDISAKARDDPRHMHDFVSSLPGLKNLPPSLLSLDDDGRVVRFDSVSKFICPGLRIGWVSNKDSAFIEKYQLLQEISTQFPSGLSQSVFLALLQSWGEEKLHGHLQQTQAHYCLQRNVMCDALVKAFSSARCSFDIPDGGMFLWLRFKSKKDLPGEAVFKVLARHGVIVVPGDDFKVPGMSVVAEASAEGCSTQADGESGSDRVAESMNVSEAPVISDTASVEENTAGEVVLRLSYAAPSPELIETGIARMVTGIKDALD